ncbi:hypothetical protein [Terasakiella pusilla]|uniref:hypothetical protein n=1 Tax=Terasakiella pusilla TaxID=64973 RepID=UPI003AA9AC27
MFRIYVSVVSLAVAIFLIVLATPLLMANIELLKVQSLKERVLAKQTLSQSEWLDLRSGHVASLQWRENYQTHLEKAKIELEISRRFPEEVEDNWRLEAEKSFEESLRNSPSNPVAWSYLAYLRKKNMVGAFHGSEEALRMALETGPHELSIAPLQLRLAIDFWDKLTPQDQTRVNNIVVWLERSRPGLLVDLATEKSSYFKFIVHALKHDDEALLRFIEGASQARF